MVNRNTLISILIDNGALHCDLNIPDNSHKGLVILVHGSGSDRKGKSNLKVAELLNDHGFSTLLIDLLTDNEKNMIGAAAGIGKNIEHLSDRLTKVIEWIQKEESTKNMKIGIFGASTGASVALIAAIKSDVEITSIVSRGGDLQEALIHGGLDKLKSAVLFLRGELDYLHKGKDEEVKEELTNVINKDVKYIPKAGHSFDGEALKQVADYTKEWFSIYLKRHFDDKTSLLKDRPTHIDMLGRWPFARHIAIRLMEIREQIKGAFLIHIHGEWGSGKSSFMYLLEKQIQEIQKKENTRKGKRSKREK